jgi:hypothetical protein
MFDGCIDHIVAANIHAVRGPTGAKIGKVVALHSFPDVTPLIFRFEPHFFLLRDLLFG